MSTSTPFGFPAPGTGGGVNPFAPPSAARPLSRWSDVPWLDGLRVHADPDGEAVARALKPFGAAPTRAAFSAFRNGQRLFPAGTPEVLLDFARREFGYSDTEGFATLPAWADRDRIRRGQTVFMTTAIPAVLVMLCKSLPEGYAAPSMARILNLSGDLQKYPQHRLMGTLQLLFGNRPTGVESFEVVAETPAAGQCAVSIGRDREEDDQYLATGGTVEVTVVDTAPRAILVVFNDLPSSTRAGATALLSGDVGAREGTFLGACDFDEL